MNRQILINILIVIFFFMGVYLVIKPLVAELHFGYAQKQEEANSWIKAMDEYQKAIVFDSSNSKYHSQLGNLYLKRGRSAQKKEEELEWFRKAKKAYEKAIKLNPNNGYYLIGWGEAQFALLSNKETLTDKELSDYINNFKFAIELAPNNYYINAAAGYYCLLFINRLDDGDKKFAFDRLRYALELNPSYSKDAYSSIWNKFGDFALLQKITPYNLKGHQELLAFLQDFGLWQYRKTESESVNAYKQKEQPELFKQERLAKLKDIDNFKQLYGSIQGNAITEFIPREKWQGKAGDNVYKDGNMYWTGTISTLLNLSDGKAVITIRAAGSPANDIYPYTLVELDGEEIGEAYVNSSEWKNYSFAIETNGGKKVLSVSFINDGGNWEKKEDRNLYVGDVKINCII